jgi:protein-S-isoprenylcysteine O-methyltransferase Ste14
MVARFLPLVGMVLFVGVGFVWRAWLQYRRHGRAGIILFQSPDWRQWCRDALLLVLLLAVTAQAVATAVAPGAVDSLNLLPAPAAGVGLVVGSVLLFGGILLMVLAQLHLGASWRVGIEEGASPGLVTGGLYTVCRNPIFLGLLVTLAGLGALQPTWISVVVLLVTIVSLHNQVVAEEAYLLAAYGDAYRHYARRVGRFLPGLGRLR